MKAGIRLSDMDLALSSGGVGEQNRCIRNPLSSEQAYEQYLEVTITAARFPLAASSVFVCGDLCPLRGKVRSTLSKDTTSHKNSALQCRNPKHASLQLYAECEMPVRLN